MTSTAAVQAEPSPIVACTISRDVQNFDLLIEDMEAELGESWGDLSFEDAAVFLTQDDSSGLEFVAVAIDEEDEDDVDRVAEIIGLAKSKGIKVLVIAEDVSPIALHQLLKLGAEEFVPYPLPDGALHDAIERMRTRMAMPEAGSVKAGGDKDGVVLPVHGLAGGCGSTTFAVNLAWELATIDVADPPKVCLLDFDLQFGSASTYLDLPRREAVYELLQDTSVIDAEVFLQAMLPFNEKLSVLTAPTEMLPLDILSQEDVARLIEFARTNFDYVIIDMPSTVVAWTETVLHAAHVYFTLLELDMRSAQNTLRLIRALKGEELPVEKLRYILNRAPKFTDLTGKSRVKRMGESLDITIEVQIPDGGRAVTEAGDHGLPLSETAGKNPVRKEIQKLAKSVHELNRSEAAAAG
ncbi:AAA family ATPase [Ovoidimarina sediminis]|uniref:AAA family ATPase n=1 Tax=Ovoidimarina sediminis TaxID=3079856 RepID=UPI002915253A|nr:AAA family ATPase [Rhodophyticola sp. MJ-SS7]MDU8942953.1 AAA family ATPase [Rhodophyticola sp. MJ-SS7]